MHRGRTSDSRSESLRWSERIDSQLKWRDFLEGSEVESNADIRELGLCMRHVPLLPHLVY